MLFVQAVPHAAKRETHLRSSGCPLLAGVDENGAVWKNRVGLLCHVSLLGVADGLGRG